SNISVAVGLITRRAVVRLCGTLFDVLLQVWRERDAHGVCAVRHRVGKIVNYCYIVRYGIVVHPHSLWVLIQLPEYLLLLLRSRLKQTMEPLIVRSPQLPNRLKEALGVSVGALYGKPMQCCTLA